MRRTLLALLFAGIAAAPLAAQEYVWLEGEAPTRATVKFETGGWGHAEYLSGGSWLHGSVEPQDMEAKIPAAGAVLSYDFDGKAAGDYETWVRVGYEFVRAPFSWRLDDGAWKESRPDELTTDLMSLQAWNEVAWLKLGNEAIKPGKHTFEIKFDRQYKLNNGKKEPDHLVFGLDAICLTKGAWLPDGPNKPDEDGWKGFDKEAAKQVFAVKPAAGGERGVTPLDGAWQIARLDEQEIKDRTEPVRELPLAADALHWKGIHVPGNRDDEHPELAYAHRFVYRTRLDVPAECKGQACFLHFPCNIVVSSAFVNGKYCGGSKAVAAAWDCDVTAAVEPGKVNELIVAIKDPYYAIANTGDPKNPSVRHMFNLPTDWFYQRRRRRDYALRRPAGADRRSRGRHPRNAVVRRRRAGLHLRCIRQAVGEEEGNRPGNHGHEPDRRPAHGDGRQRGRAARRRRSGKDFRRKGSDRRARQGRDR